ncbi:PREDICTED: uncharacterized protein LOC108972789 [Bactrocera latifrons]|nr:PREDICTED: uncharacterized protein LOC108972789 [Bactrocera latifrons]
MYAAAGGASLASRQARQRQRQQKKTQQLQAKLHPPKLSALSGSEHGASTPTRTQSRQFHQLPTNYLRTPQTQSRKLSTSYTTQSKLLLPIDEGDNQSVLQMRVQYVHTQMHHSHSHAHPIQAHQHPHYQFAHQQHHSHGGILPKLVHRHSGSGASSFQQTKLPKSATATLPLVSQMEATPPTTPLAAAECAITTSEKVVTIPVDKTSINVSHHDAIIVTPATPMPSPGHVGKPEHQQPKALSKPFSKIESNNISGGTINDEEHMKEPPSAPLERKCSVYRMRRNDPYEYQDANLVGGVGSSIRRQLKDLQFNQQQQYEPLLSNESHLCYKGLTNTRKWQVCAYCEEGICVCEHIECTRGRAAWLERGRRCSVQEAQQQAACHRRWVKRNRVQDASLAGSSDDEDLLGVLRGPSTFANTFLYVGLGTIALGLVIAFVGTGEKGFKTVELRLIGPSLIGLGFVCCMLRILFCICPSHCISTNKKTFKKDCNKNDADYTTSLLRGEGKRVSISRRPTLQPKYPITHKRGSNKILNEGMEALRQIATTSLFMQNEQKASLNRIVPIIKEPENLGESTPKKSECLRRDELEHPRRIQNTESNSKVNCNDGNISSVESKINITAINANTTSIEKFPNVSSKKTLRENSIEMPEVSLDQQLPSFTTTLTSEPISSSSSSKLSRQRIALNNKLIPEVQSHAPIAPNYTKDTDFLMETSLSIKPTTTASEVTPALIHGTSSSTSNNTYNYSGLTDNASTVGVHKTSTTATATITPASIGSEQKLEQINIHSNIETRTNTASNVSTIMSPCAILSNSHTSVSNTPITTNMCSRSQSIFVPGQIEDNITTIAEPVVNQPEPNNLRLSKSGFSNASFIFPSPLLSSSDSESDGSSALSPSQATVIQKIWARADQLPDASTSTNAIISHDNKYVMPQNHPLSIMEPELLLSPAKLGQ